MVNDPVAIARASYDAYVRKDRGALEALVAPDFHFTSPLDNRLDRTAYFARCWPNSEGIAAFRFIRCVQDGEAVLLTYEGTRSDGQGFRNTEVLTIRGGQIVEAEVYFGWSLPHRAPVGGFVEAEAG